MASATQETSGTGSPTETAATPKWFVEALSVEPKEVEINVDGCPIRILRWGSGPKTPLVLVHGNGAHARWWSFIAPFLATDRVVAALDLGGMGDSGARTDYSPQSFAGEIAAVIESLNESGAGKPADIVAHSFGGLVSTWLAHGRKDLVRRLFIVDTPFLTDDNFQPSWRMKKPVRRFFESEADALQRFRLLPPQECDNGYLFDYVARHSVRRTEEGWTWKFSSNPWDFPAFRDRFWSRTNQCLSGLSCPVAFIRGADSALCDADMAGRWRSLAGDAAPIVTIPAAQHHIMLDQPLALVTALRGFIETMR